MAENGKELELLMATAIKGDSRAYREVLSQISRILRPFISKKISSPSEVEDVLQEILISIHKARHTYDCKRPLLPWIYAIAKFRMQDHLRKVYADKLRFAGNYEELENIAAPDVTKSDLSYESIKQEIYQLPGKQPMILHLIHSEGYTAKEVAGKMCMTESAVKVAAHRAYKVLKKKLANDR